jgi:transcriptional regulator with PAS, ATPase and Fis domain
VVSLRRFIRDQEVAYLQHVLKLANQNKEEAARLLDISLATLYRKLSDEE